MTPTIHHDWLDAIAFVRDRLSLSRYQVGRVVQSSDVHFRQNEDRIAWVVRLNQKEPLFEAAVPLAYSEWYRVKQRKYMAYLALRAYLWIELGGRGNQPDDIERLAGWV